MDSQKGNIQAIASEKGIALLMVLWVLTILMVIVLSFSSMTRTDTYSTLSFKERTEKKLLAESGIERGIMELFYRMQYIATEGSEVWKTDATPYSDQMEEDSYTVRITDESGKVDINSGNPVILRNLLFNLEIPDEEVETIADSIEDWKDSDDLYRLNGAESDYYMSLPNPYQAKNANFDTLEELLLVKGVTPEILYGNEERRGIIDFLTVHSKRSVINLNAAPKEVLTAIPGITPEIADAIITYRETKEITSFTEIQPILGPNLGLIQPFISTGGSNTFTIEAIGKKGNNEAGFGIRATVIIEGTNQYKYIYYKSPATIRQ